MYFYDEYLCYDKEFLVLGGVDFLVKLWDIFIGDLLYMFFFYMGELFWFICILFDCSVRVLVFRLVICFKLIFLVELLYLFFLELCLILYLFSSLGLFGCIFGIVWVKVYYVGFFLCVFGWDDKMVSFRWFFGGGLYWWICVCLVNGNRWDL